MRRNATSQTHATLTANAKQLGVHRVTLWRALRGRSHSPALLARYRDLVRLRTKPQPETL